MTRSVVSRKKSPGGGHAADISLAWAKGREHRGQDVARWRRSPTRPRVVGCCGEDIFRPIPDRRHLLSRSTSTSSRCTENDVKEVSIQSIHRGQAMSKKSGLLREPHLGLDTLRSQQDTCVCNQATCIDASWIVDLTAHILSLFPSLANSPTSPPPLRPYFSPTSASVTASFSIPLRA